MSGTAAAEIWKSLENLKAKSPVVHNITNYVVMNSTANALLALGASPVMAHAGEEVTDMVGIASALVINIGTLSREWVESMFRAAQQAKDRQIPIVLDPVGAGATPYRTRTARDLVKEFRPEIIRGNASEIMALIEDSARTKGVDSSGASHEAVSAGSFINEAYGSAVCISGEMDYLIGKGEVVRVRNGHPMMTRVTGMGCTATALCGAFAAVDDRYFNAAVHAMAVMGIAGEIAAEGSAGPGTMQVRFLDTLYRLNGGDIETRLKLES